jgi:Phosphoesterase family/IPT/TIG domain
MLIVDENKDYTATNLPAGNNRYIISNPEAPYLNQLAGQYASATQEYSLFHPSFKNYLALLSGAVISSGTVAPTDTTLVKQLSDAGVPWTAYVDGLNFPGAPSSCDPNVTDQEVYDDVSPYYYEWDHNPFWYFNDITNTQACNNVVPYPGSTSLVSTLDGPGAPDFVWISPNGCNDGHDTAPPTGTCQYNETESADLWLQGSTNLEGVTPTLSCPLYCLDLPSILSSSWYQSGGIIIITWDEAPNTDTLGGGLPDTNGGQIATLVISSTAHGAFNTPGNDYSILRAIDEAYGLPLLGQAADPANGDLSGAFGVTISAPPPSVAGVTPTEGPLGGGALVTVNGSNFNGPGFTASDVLVGSTDIPASNAYPCSGSSAGCFAVTGPTQMSLFTPTATSAGTADISVVTPGGRSPTVVADEYTYVAPAAYVALTPFRICDTRPAGPGIAANQCNTGSGRTLGAGHETITVQITAAGGPVPTGAQAVVMNVTAINRSIGGTYITAFPAGGSRPVASNINLSANALGTNLVIVQLSASGQVSVFNAVGGADVILDVQGYFVTPGGTSAGEFHSIPPLRICDTRAKQGTVCAGATDNPLIATTSAGAWRRVVLSGPPPGALGGTPSIPATGAAGAAFNLTATGGTRTTLLAVEAPDSADACPTTPPRFSNVNPPPGGALPNRVISSLGPKADVCIFNAVGSINFIIDVDGWFGTAGAPAGAFFYSVAPTRICDTRAGSGKPCAGNQLTPNAFETIAAAGVLVLPGEGGSTPPVAMVANLTAVAGSASTYFTLYPSDAASPPRASDLNPAAGQVIANLAVVGLATTGPGTVDGHVNLYNAVGHIDAILDVAGWFQ